MSAGTCLVQWSDKPCLTHAGDEWHICVRDRFHDSPHECSCLAHIAIEAWEWDNVTELLKLRSERNVL